MPATYAPLKVECLIAEKEASTRVRLSRVSLWNARNQVRNPLKFVRIGRGIFYEPAELDRWILSNGRCAARAWSEAQRRNGSGRPSGKRTSGSPSTVRASRK